MDRLCYTVEEFCKELTISKSFYYKYCRIGKMPTAIKLGSRTVIPKASVDEWLKKASQEPKGYLQ